ncbi:MAG: M23 family metallopeptidase [Acidimicrobiales bacterium]
MSVRRRAAGLLLALALACAGAVGPAGAERRSDAAGWRTYRPPTDGAVLDPFRPPPQPWLAGNRGIEYRTEPGADLVAIGPGTVAFAGSVAGRLVVSIVHPDGLRSSLTGVAELTVAAGTAVWAGAPIAIAADRVHLGVRRGDAYLDPATLWGTQAGGGHVRLVPRFRRAGLLAACSREPRVRWSSSAPPRPCRGEPVVAPPQLGRGGERG